MNVYLLGIIISMAIYVIIGLIISKKIKNSEDYYVAGRKAPTLLITGSLIASYCSTGIFMGTAGETYGGFFGPYIITFFILVTGYVLGSIFFGKYLRRSEVITIPEFFGKRFNSKKIQKLAAFISLVIYFVYMVSVMQGIGSLMNIVTGLNYNVCVLLSLICFTILTFTSGSQGVLITDTIMFGLFTSVTLICSFIIIGKAGGINTAIQNITAINPDFFSWHGNLNHLYDNGLENIIWAVCTGLTWISVAMVAPWQSSRYLMAKNEHTVIRASIFSSIGVFFMELIISFTAAIVFAINQNIVPGTTSMIWASMNCVPTILGVVMLTGVVAAGISSATTFLSLIGGVVSNDLFNIKDDKKKINVGKITVIIAAILIYIVTLVNPENIYVILCLGATVVACSWFPTAIVSIWSKKTSKYGAFIGMLLGFLVCSIMKIYSAIKGISIPAYLDPFIFGILANIIGIIIGSKFKKPSKEEINELNKLKIVPKIEKDDKEISKTKNLLKFYLILPIIFVIVFLIIWVIPYLNALK